MEFLNFKKLELSGRSKEDAFAQAPFEVKGNATLSYRKWLQTNKGSVNSMELREFMLKYLEEHSKNGKGIGFYIEVKSASLNRSKKPYQLKNIATTGPRKYKSIYQIIDRASNTILAEISENKAMAKEVAKKLYTENGFTGDLVCKLVKQVVEGESTVFEVSYKPSKNTCDGTYIVFGIAKD